MGVLAILYSRFGFYGWLIIGVVILMIPLQILIGKVNGTLTQEGITHKDKRIKVCTEMIEGIRFIKLYGW